MTRDLLYAVGVIGAAMLAVVQPGGAIASGEPMAHPVAASDPFAQAIAARGVADFARRQHDVGAMIVAARMLREVPFNGPESGGGTGGDATFTPAGLFGEARAMAKGDPALLLQITVAEATGARGVIASAFGKGLVRSVQTVSPRAAYQFSVDAKGGEPLRVGAIGDVGTALLMRMQDAGGRTVCLDDQGDYGPVCQLTPRVAAKYRVDIVNKSAVKSRAVILSN